MYFIEHKAEADRVADQVLINKRSREQAEKARLNIRKKLTGSMDIVEPRAEVRRLPQPGTSRSREIYIVEGDSALGACKLSRDAEFQGIMPVRGKILNCLKADYGRIFKSEIITDLIKVAGLRCGGAEASSRSCTAFELESLRWSKVIICTDADVDGFQIRTLILTMLYRLAPTLIREGYVYIAETPLFEIHRQGQDVVCLLRAREGGHSGGAGRARRSAIQRSKGLG